MKIALYNYLLCYVYRAANSVAESWVKLASTTLSPYVFTFSNLPTYIWGIVALDYM